MSLFHFFFWISYISDNIQYLSLSDLFFHSIIFFWFPGGLVGKEFACSVEDLSLLPGLGRFPGEGNSYPLQYSALENPMDR